MERVTLFPCDQSCYISALQSPTGQVSIDIQYRELYNDYNEIQGHGAGSGARGMSEVEQEERDSQERQGRYDKGEEE